MNVNKQAVRSFLTTVVSVLGLFATIAVIDGVSVPGEWVAFGVTATAVVRTVIAWLDSGNTSFGRGSE